MKKILIVDDDIDMCTLLNHFLKRKGYKVCEVHSCRAAWQHIEHDQPDLVLCDVWLGDMDGITLLKKVKAVFFDIPFVFITAYNDIKTSANAMKYGALDYVTKPLMPEEIATIVTRALDIGINRKNKATHKPGEVLPDFFYGATEPFKKLYRQVILVASTDYSVTIQGESGSGKKALAREIHLKSHRSHQPFVVFNCGSKTADLAEAGLFGSEIKTDGNKVLKKRGCLELANGGTLVLENVPELPCDAQIKLINALREKKITRVGEGKATELDIRLLSTANENLWHATNNKKLTEDAYKVLNDFSIDILPLRNRRDDIVLFATHFLELANRLSNKEIKGLTCEVEIIFKNHVWQDNLRELKNVINKAVFLSQTSVIDAACLPPEICPFVKNNTTLLHRQQLRVMG